MPEGVLVVALGQRFGGDDAVGLAVGERLRGAPGVVVVEARDAADLIEAIEAGGDVIVVDAVRCAGEPGTVRVLLPEDLGREASVSSHGLDVAGAIALARALRPDAPAPRVRIVGVTIAGSDPFREGMSPAVAAAVEPAVQVVLRMTESPVAKELPGVIAE
jgi:hydrogenase maturation protease